MIQGLRIASQPTSLKVFVAAFQKEMDIVLTQLIFIIVYSVAVTVPSTRVIVISKTKRNEEYTFVVLTA